MGRSAVECVWAAKLSLGEGVIWHDSRLYFVDIKRAEILAYDPLTQRQLRWSLPEMVGWVVPRERGGWIAGLRSGIVALSLQDGGVSQVDWLHRLHEPTSPWRLNDAKVGPGGRLWFGSMHDADDTSATGCLYRLDPDLSLHVVERGYRIPNGPTFSLDGRTMYHTDSGRREIYAYTLDPHGNATDRRTWVQFGAADGAPDGMTTDAQGRIWVAQWGASAVTCRDGETAGVLQRVELPVSQVTNVCFGGAHGNDLYITSARVGLSADALQAQPLAGGLFRLRGAGNGVAGRLFRG